MKAKNRLGQLIFSFLSLLFFLSKGYSVDRFYWESPERIQNSNVEFPNSVSNGKISVAVWQESDKKNETIYLNSLYWDQDGTYKKNIHFAGPFSYSGELPDVHHEAINKDGVIVVTTLSSLNLINIHTSRDGGKTYTSVEHPQKQSRLIAPRVYALADGRFGIFASVSNPSSKGMVSFSLYVSYSDDGIQWTDFKEIEQLTSLKNPFYPFIVYENEGNYLICQAQYQESDSITYQLYSSFSPDGKTWSQPVMITGSDSFTIPELFYDYDNQRPFAFNNNGKIVVSWERREVERDKNTLWIQQIDKNGTVAHSAETIAESGSPKSTVLFSYDQDFYAAWQDNHSGIESIYLGKYDGSDWDISKLSSSRLASTIAMPLINQNRLSLAWIETTGAGIPRLYLLLPDTTVNRPSVSPVGFKEGKHSKNKKAKFRITLPKDSSGIAGYVYSWSQDKSVLPDIENSSLESIKNTNLVLDAVEEGEWFLKVRIQDNAGNWSDSTENVYYLDLTPPKIPVVSEEKMMQGVFPASNSAQISWDSDEADGDVAGYTYELKYLGPVSSVYCTSPGHPLKVSKEELDSYGDSLIQKYEKEIEKGTKLKDQIVTSIPQASFKNLKNGVYVLSVAAIDEVGYVGQVKNIPVLINNYIPRTRIYSVKAKETAFGEVSFDITGNDFLFNGTISRVYVDKDGKAPYDLVIQRAGGGFKVESNTKISGINIGTDLDEGKYFVGIVHTDRGLLMTGSPVLKVETNGTVKVFKEYEYVPAWKSQVHNFVYSVHLGTILLHLILFISLWGILFYGKAVLQNVREMRKTRKTVYQLEKGEFMAESKSKRKGSLKRSLMGFTASLVMFNIVLLSILLGSTMLKTQERTLSQGLQQRVNVLLSSVVTGATSSLPSEDLLELSQLHNQMTSLSEAEYLTVTGQKAESFNTKDNLDSLLYVWDSNDENITNRVDRLNSRKTSFEPGYSVLSKNNQDELEALDKCQELNLYLLHEYKTQILERETLQKKLKTSEGAEASMSIQKLDQKLKEAFEEQSSKNAGAIPYFNTDSLDRNTTEYTFYQPVIYRSNKDQNFVHGIVFLKVSTASLIKSVDDARNRIITIVLIISVILIAIGAITAVLFATAIVKPIQKLEKAVKDISEEHDKERLLGNEIKNLPNNEIGRLGESVNRMQKDLGWNAQELNLQLNASEIQQALVPLQPLQGNVKQNIARIKTENFDQFAYYKGAAGVSGDYFDCKKLDNRWYVLIKCDASGHAAPAGILVTIVATLYKKYFENWSYAKNGTRLDEFVYLANDFLEGLNIKGKFVALFICLYDSKTGDVFMCHAGDKILRIYDSKAKKLNKIELPETPAVGPIPSFMVQMKGGYTVEKRHLNNDDILLLYTDGIEENGRAMRNLDFSTIMKPKLNEQGQQLSDEYGNLLFEVEKEEFGETRVKEITEAVLAKKKYILKKESNPTSETLEFDFSTCEGTVQDVILALTSIEKVFRLYKPENLTENDLVEVDMAVDGFLKDHFNLYDTYAQISQLKSKNPNYVLYSRLHEDVQEDDLTMLALHRP